MDEDVVLLVAGELVLRLRHELGLLAARLERRRRPVPVLKEERGNASGNAPKMRHNCAVNDAFLHVRYQFACWKCAITDILFNSKFSHKFVHFENEKNASGNASKCVTIAPKMRPQ